MPIAALVFGILGLVIFCWLGPVIGGGVAAAVSVSAGEFVAWPIWVLGLVLGAGVPLVGLILGVLGMKKDPERKGLGIGGIVTGAIGILAALVISTGVFIAGKATASLAPMTADALRQANDQMQNLSNQLNDQNLQKQLQDQIGKAMQQAAQGQGQLNSDPAPTPPPAPGATPTPGAVPTPGATPTPGTVPTPGAAPLPAEAPPAH